MRIKTQSRFSPVSIGALCGLAILLTAAVTPRPAVAQDDKARAKDLFLEGVDLFARDNLPEALSAFERSYELRPKNSVLFNIGMCQKALFRYVDSIVTFRRFLDEGGADIKRSTRRDAEAAIAEMEKLVGFLKVSDAPEGAELTIDGSSRGVVSGEETVTLDPGLHSVRVEKEGFKLLRTDVTIASDATVTLKAQLPVEAAKLKIDCKIEGGIEGVVYIDGRVCGECPFEGEREAASVVVTVKAEGMEDFSAVVDLEQGSTVTLSAVLEPIAKPIEKPPVPGSSALMITGIAALAVGVGAGAMGGYFTYRGSSDHGDLEVAAKAGEASRYEALKDDLSTDKALMAVGYASAGAFLIAGVVLLALDASDEGKAEAGEGESTLHLGAAPGGLTLEF